MTNMSPTSISILPMCASASTRPSARSTQLRPSAPGLPPALLRQLRVGGRLVIPVGDSQSQRMVRVTREGPEAFVREEFEEFRFVPLLGAGGWPT